MTQMGVIGRDIARSVFAESVVTRSVFPFEAQGAQGAVVRTERTSPDTATL